MKLIAKFWTGIALLIILSPLGLILPQRFKAGSAWGEWGVNEIRNIAGYMPKGLARLSTSWSAPFPAYAFKGWEEKGLFHLSLAYIISAIIGIAIVTIVALIIGKYLTKKGD
jgi:cobalt/nickel transport protein